MILTELRAAIEEKGSITRQELARRFSLSEDGVDAMLSVWIKKGVVSRQQYTNSEDAIVRVRYVINREGDLAVSVTM
ncbi:iron transporter FeoC [Vibrio mimicus]|uniref:FeoC-like transcriptional regulator n=1 Tax=Vibrio mimicus TaxID=674 RepID=UPI0011D2EBB3|nr:FeoC-like transcriptional regulator [Vibrio mimicus]TXX98285.1 iron transporter FeoC [Vibrio mimicus]TXY45082.1 iron transporter FeoC [Vibrio mimicus]